LIPDVAHDVMTGGFGSSGSTSYALCAATPEGDLAVAYLWDTSLSPRFDLSAFSGSTATVSWVDPSNEAVRPVAGSPFPTEGEVAFSPPGDNAEGSGDWILLVEAR
jgi:hypothetical protein